MTGSTPTDTYPLSPLQREMLLARLYGAEAGVDLEQLCVRLEEPVEPEALRAAFEEVALRHPALASAIRWEGLEEPVQEVHARLQLPLSVHDWSAAAPGVQAERRRDFLRDDRRRGLELTRPPLMRLALLRYGPQSWELVWSFHHILLDGRSFVHVLDEVLRTCAARREGRAPQLPRRPPYRGFIDWLGRRDAAGAEAFWSQLLRDAPLPTPLPLAASGPRGARQPTPCHAERVLEGPTLQALHGVARQHGVTLATVLNGAWAILLARLTGERDVTFGVTRAGRRSVEGMDTEQAVGLFINTLPVRARLLPATRLGELLRELRRQSLALRPYEHTPLTEVQAACGAAQRGPLFQTLCMVETSELTDRLQALDPAWKGRAIELYEQPSLPLALTAYAGSALRLRLLFQPTRYDQDTAERLVGHLKTLLEGMARLPEATVDELPLLTEAEQRRIVQEWNDTARPFPSGLCIQELCQRALALDPDAPAVTDGQRTLTRGELHARANQLARHLRALGVRPGQRVAVCLERSVELVVSLLAVLESGAAYVPLDPAYPEERLAFMLEDTAAPVVITQRSVAARLPPHRAVQLVLEEVAEALARLPAGPLVRAQGPEDLAYVIYTSGSTGQPKGVMLRHRAVVNTLDWVNRSFGVGPADRLLFVTSPCFDLSVYDVFGALAAGALVRVATAQELEEPARLVELLTQGGITLWDSAPASLQRLVPSFPAGKHASLRLVLLSGDWIPVTLPDQVRATFPRAAVHSLGGATEAAIWSNHFPIGEVDPRWASIPYGRPIQNARYHVLDARLQPVPVGVTGELYIGGTCLADGYLQREELTRERFVADPFSSLPGERLYRTGDLARYFPDGNLEFLGRIDSQVKIRGFRVELGEVEAVLATAPGVREAVALAREDGSGTKVLAAYLTARPGATLDAAALKRHAEAKLPAYMVPSHFVLLAALPLSANGKVDRQALPPPAAASQGQGRSIVAPRCDVELALQGVWQELFKVSPIGVTESFFDLGGHSLLGALLLARIRKELGHALPLGVLFKAPTIEKLAQVIRQKLEAGAGGCLVPLRPGGARPALFLVSGAGGHVFQIHRLGRLLPPEQPLYAFKAVGADAERPPAQTIEEAAEVYLQEILALPSRGPYVLGGYSVGGLVAFEVALRLRALGLRVDRLVLLDVLAPGYPRLEPLPTRLLLHARALLQQDAAQRRAYLQERYANLRRRVLGLLGRSAPQAPLAAGAEGVGREALEAVWQGLHHAQQLYRPRQPFEGDVLLVKSLEGFRWAATRFDDPLLGWGDWVKGTLVTESLPGDHLQLFEERNLAPLATLLATWVTLPHPSDEKAPAAKAG